MCWPQRYRAQLRTNADVAITCYCYGVGHCSHCPLSSWDACIYMSDRDPSSVVKERKFNSLVVQRLIGGSFSDSKREVYRLWVQGLRERVQLLSKNQVSCNIYGRDRSLTQRILVGCHWKSSCVATHGNLIVAMLSRIVMSRLCVKWDERCNGPGIAPNEHCKAWAIATRVATIHCSVATNIAMGVAMLGHREWRTKLLQ